MPNCPQPVPQVRKDTCPPPTLRIGIERMEYKRIKSKPCRYSYLRKGGARPRRNYALIIALVCMVLLSFAGIVSADSYYKGSPPVTNLTGTVNGEVNAKFVDTWKTDNPVNNDSATAEFTGLPTSGVKFGRLYIVPFSHGLNENWRGTLTVTLARSGYSDVILADHQPLDLEYDRTAGTTCNTSVPVPPFTSSTNGLCRVMTQYVAIFNITPYMTSSGMTLYLSTTNVSGRFDGRIKEAALVYGYDVAGSGTTYYWLNEGQDPITKKITDGGAYTANQTVFSGVTSPRTYTANLWVDAVAGNSTSGPGHGNYWWYANNVQTNISVGTSYPPTVNQGVYAGLNKWSWSSGAGNNPGLVTGDNTLRYSKTNDYYKIIFALFSIK